MAKLKTTGMALATAAALLFGSVAVTTAQAEDGEGEVPGRKCLQRQVRVRDGNERLCGAEQVQGHGLRDGDERRMRRREEEERSGEEELRTVVSRAKARPTEAKKRGVSMPRFFYAVAVAAMNCCRWKSVSPNVRSIAVRRLK